MAERIKIADVAPAYCSSCFSQKPRMVHVDFGAFYDGPVIRSEEGLVQHQIDDLIICRDCLRRAGLLVGLGEVEKVEAELHNAVEENDRLMERLRGLQVYVDKMEEAMALRPNGKPKPKARAA
jgi:hypothetical protein